MSRTLLLILMVVALGLATYNVTLLDFENPFEGNSLIACIGILASLCAIVLLLILYLSKQIHQKLK
ncbi:hypothetical protein GCM10011414_06940 [Croceivirga lutea]|uniref:hypothetical protein n=1 Tax=Croceivirga lutea TaxID=1775167 RepID=UPI00163B3A3E|nr:hypothetical protein [Croceivirga lutea]GGG40065.1 hypothetical protein GCM10011414_06940 [Croceivirga lutea]